MAGNTLGGSDTTKNVQTTVNQNLGLNAGGIGATGQGLRGAYVNTGGIGLNRIGGGRNSGDTTVTIQNLDIDALTTATGLVHDALEYGQDTTHDALIANQNITLASQEVNRQVSLASINAGNVGVISALSALQRSQEINAGLAKSAVDAAQQTALQAAPVSAGNYALAASGNNAKVVYAIVAVVGIYLAVKAYKT